jgi:hypothetical protein
MTGVQKHSWNWTVRGLSCSSIYLCSYGMIFPAFGPAYLLMSREKLPFVEHQPEAVLVPCLLHVLTLTNLPKWLSHSWVASPNKKPEAQRVGETCSRIPSWCVHGLCSFSSTMLVICPYVAAIYDIAYCPPMSCSHFHFLLHVRLLISEQLVEQKHIGCQWQGVIPELKADVLSVASVQIVLIPPPTTHSITAKCSGQKSNKTGSQSCFWGQAGHRSLHWHVGHISQMTGAQLESSKWLLSDVGDLLHVWLITVSLKQSRPGLGLVRF